MRWLLLLLMCCTMACATPYEEVVPVRLVWPEPPALARIEFERTIHGAADVEGNDSSVWSSVAAALGVRSRAPGRPIGHAADVAAARDGRRVYVSDFVQGIVHVFDLERRETWYLG